MLRPRQAARRCVAVLIACVSLTLVPACSSSGPERAPSSTQVVASHASSASPTTTSPTPTSPSTPASTAPARAAVTTPQGMWWGVDSTVRIDKKSLANVRHWYRGKPTPQFWGRYLGGSFATDKAELTFARKHGIYVFLIVPDRNCSGCSGGDVCGQDRTQAQARTDATHAITEARKLGVPQGTLLFKDIEEVGGCSGPTGEYLIAWYRTLRATEFRTGFYGNVHQQGFDFPRAYCSALKTDGRFADDVVLDMNEDEPLIGAPQGSTGPHNAPKFHPKSPDCAQKAATVIWQYGESLTTDNLTDIDQARHDITGLLAPDGGVS